MSGAFTRGPWNDGIYHEGREGARYRVFVTASNEPVPIACVPTGVEGYGREEGRANARLIASAPDLYEALEEAIRYIEGYRDMPFGVHQRIRTALAKASLRDEPQ